MDDMLTMPTQTNDEEVIDNISTMGSVKSSNPSTLQTSHSGSLRSSREKVNGRIYHDKEKLSMISGTSLVPLPDCRGGAQMYSKEYFGQKFLIAHPYVCLTSPQFRPYNYSSFALLISLGAPWFGLPALYYAQRSKAAMADGNLRQSWYDSTKSLVWALFGIGSVAITLFLCTSFIFYLNVTCPEAIKSALGVQYLPTPTIPTVIAGPIDLQVLAKNDNNAPKSDNTVYNNGVTIHSFESLARHHDYGRGISTTKSGTSEFGNRKYQMSGMSSGLSTKGKGTNGARQQLEDLRDFPIPSEY